MCQDGSESRAFDPPAQDENKNIVQPGVKHRPQQLRIHGHFGVTFSPNEVVAPHADGAKHRAQHNNMSKIPGIGKDLSICAKGKQYGFGKDKEDGGQNSR